MGERGGREKTNAARPVRSIVLPKNSAVKKKGKKKGKKKKGKKVHESVIGPLATPCWYITRLKTVTRCPWRTEPG